MLDWLRTKKGHGVAGSGQNYAGCQVKASENTRLHRVWQLGLTKLERDW
jgi:hypothetical protein